MNLKKSKTDLYYKELLKKQDVDRIIEFIKKETDALIELEHLIGQCIDDRSYDYNFLLLQKIVSKIRTPKLTLLENKFGYFDSTKKKYFKKLLEDIEMID